MKKKFDFSRVAAIVLFCLYLGWLLLENGTLYLRIAICAFTGAPLLPEGAPGLILPSVFSVFSSQLLPLLPLVLLLVGLMAKRNRLLLGLGTALLIGQRLSGLLVTVINLVSESFDVLLGEGSLLQTLGSALSLITSLAMLTALILFLLTLTGKKPLPAFLQVLMRFLPVLPLLPLLLYPITYGVWCNDLSGFNWAFFDFVEISRFIYPFFGMIPSMLSTFAFVFAADALTEPETSHKKGALLVGAGGGVLFLLANLLSVGIASLSLLLYDDVAFFAPSFLLTLAWVVCFLLFGLGAILIPAATIRFSNGKTEDEPVEAPAAATPQPRSGSPLRAELLSFKQLQKDGLVSEADYDTRKAAILSKPLPVKSGTTLAGVLLDLRLLQEEGLITQDDYDAQKEAVLGGPLTTKLGSTLPNALRALKQLQEEGFITQTDYDAQAAVLLSSPLSAKLSGNLSDSLEALKQLQKDGLISEEDYEAKKKHLLGL